MGTDEKVGHYVCPRSPCSAVSEEGLAGEEERRSRHVEHREAQIGDDGVDRLTRTERERQFGVDNRIDGELRRGVAPELADKIARILARLDVAKAPEQLDLPGLRLHPLKGRMKGHWAIWVSERELADHLPLRAD